MNQKQNLIYIYIYISSSSSSSSSRADSTDITDSPSPLFPIVHLLWQVFRATSSHSCCMYVLAGRPAFARPYVGVHGSTSLMSSSLLLQQRPASSVRLIWIVYIYIYIYSKIQTTCLLAGAVEYTDCLYVEG